MTRLDRLALSVLAAAIITLGLFGLGAGLIACYVAGAITFIVAWLWTRRRRA